jgi:histidinol-phosphate aminotransferase
MEERHMTNDADARRLWNRKTHSLIPYVPGEQPRDRAFIKLNTNENPYPPALEVMQAVRDFPAERLRLYPDPTSLKLRQCLAAYYGVAEKQIFVGNGSDEILAMAFQAFFRSRCEIDASGKKPQDCLVFPDITYSFYPVYARMYDIPYRTVRLGNDFSLPLAACLEPSAGLVLANPNAPTGIAIGLEDLAALAASDRNRLVLVDEAYVDFGAESAIALLDRFDNILVVQTCSKSRALAGLRVGFAFGDPALIEGLERVRDSFNSYTLDSLAQSVATAAYASPGWFETTRARIIATREKTAAGLAELGFEVLPSSANFLFVRHTGFSGEHLYRELRREGILVRHFRLPRIEDHLRITIGLPEDMAKLVGCLREIVARQPAGPGQDSP